MKRDVVPNDKVAAGGRAAAILAPQVQMLMAATIFKFGDYRLDRERFELSRAGHAVKLERKPMELLILLAESQGNLVARAEIAERLWGGEVFVDTEHGINTAIRKIRQALRDDPEQPRFLHTVTGKGYRFVCEPVESQPREVQSVAALETTISGDAAGSGDSYEVPLRLRRRMRWWLALGSIVAALVLAVFLGIREHWQGTRGPGAPVNINSLAVIPLDNLSGDPGQEYFADGMTDELITMLAKNSTLRVTSRTSVMQYKGVHRPLPEIAKALGVDGILEGSIAREGDRVHMTVQLIHASDDSHVWAESYDRDANDLVLLPRDAAVAIATKLKSLVAQPAPHYVNPAAHDAYLRGKALWFSDRDMESGAYFKKAIELQPDYSLGWSGLAKYYGDGADEGVLRPDEALGPGMAAAKKAVELDDSSAEAHIALGAAYWLTSAWPQALTESSRAIDLGPGNGETYQLRAMLMITLNRDQEAIEIEKKSLEVDPFARPYGLAMIYLAARQYDAAIADARQRLEYVPRDAGVWQQIALAYEAKGMYQEEEETWMRESEFEEDKTSAAKTHLAYLRGGHKAVLLQDLQDLQQRASKQYESPYFFADLYAKLGDREKALSFLETALRERSPLLLWIQSSPEFDFLHGEARYRAVVTGMGLPPAW